MFVPKKYFTLVMALSLLFCFPIFAYPVQFSPDQIVLNAAGQQEDLLVIVRKSMPAGYYIDSFQVTLSLDGTQITEAYALRYCYTDDNYLVSFDWQEIINNPDVMALAGTTVTGSIFGTVTITNAQEDIKVETLDGSDDIEIIDPQWQMSVYKSDLPPAGDDILLGFDNDTLLDPTLLLWDRGQGAETAYGQTFKFAQPIKLNKITLKIMTSDIDISDKAVELWIGNGYHHVNDSRLTSLILEPNARLPLELGIQQTWYLTFDFIDLYLLADTDYGFMLKFAGGGADTAQSTGLQAYIYSMGSYAYDDGAAFVYNGNWPGTLLDNELVFFLHGEVVSTSPILGDIVIDYTVDMFDFAAIAVDWLKAVDCCQGPDISCDAYVDIVDLKYLTRNWLDTLSKK